MTQENLHEPEFHQPHRFAAQIASMANLKLTIDEIAKREKEIKRVKDEQMQRIIHLIEEDESEEDTQEERLSDEELAEQTASEHKKSINESLKHDLCINETQRKNIADDLEDAQIRVSDEKIEEKDLILIIILTMLLNGEILHIDELTKINASIDKEPRIALNPDEIYEAIESAFILMVGNGYATKVEEA